MGRRSIRWMWVVSAAALLGVVIGAGSAGAKPAWLPAVVALLVALPSGLTVSSRVRRYRRTRRRERQRIAAREVARLPSGPAPGQTPSTPYVIYSIAAELADADWQSVRELCCALSRRQIAWLRSNEFALPWLDSQIRPALETKGLVEKLAVKPFPVALHEALRGLADAVAALGTFYVQNAIRDPLVSGEDWRFFDWEARSAFPAISSSGGEGDGRAARMRRLSAAVADAYEAVVETADADPKARKRITVGA